VNGNTGMYKVYGKQIQVDIYLMGNQKWIAANSCGNPIESGLAQ
jgi:hypothetical protein